MLWQRDLLLVRMKREIGHATAYRFADDDFDIREMVQFMLHAAGFRVSTTDNAAEVLRLVTSEHVDAVLLDNWMSEITGVELCRQIRTFDKSRPILMCSGAVTLLETLRHAPRRI